MRRAASLRIREKKGTCREAVMFPCLTTCEWADHGVTETAFSILAGPEGQTGRSCAFSSFSLAFSKSPSTASLPLTAQYRQLARPQATENNDLRLILRPEYTLYGCLLSPEFMQANCNHIPAGSQASASAAVLFQRWHACSGCLIACCLNVLFAFSTMCGGKNAVILWSVAARLQWEITGP